MVFWEIFYKKVQPDGYTLRSPNYKMGGVSIISGTLTSVSGAFPTFVIQLIVIMYCHYMLYIFICQFFKASILNPMSKLGVCDCM